MTLKNADKREASNRAVTCWWAPAALAGAALATGAASAAADTQGARPAAGRSSGSTITTKDGTQIYYKDWGSGSPVVFSHGWPLTSDAWEAQMFFLASNGYRCTAHDRRCHGRSSQPWNGNEMDTYADDLALLCEAFELKGAVMIGHSPGGGEVAHFIGRHGTKRVKKAVLMGAVPPIMLKTAAYPDGCRWRSSTASARPTWPTARSSSSRSRAARSSASTGPGPRSRRG